MNLVALRDAMGAVLPDAGDTNLLRACLCSGDTGRAAWQAFAREAGDLRELFRADRGGRRRLGPLLATTLRDNAVAADPALLTVIRTSHLREELRAEIYSEILGDALEALRAVDVPVLVLTGAAFGWSLYASPALRHSHDIDLLVREHDVPAAMEALAARGFRRTGPAQVEHRRALPVNLHSRFLPPVEGPGSFDAAWTRRQTVPIAGHDVPVPSPGDSLFQVLGLRALNPTHQNLQWACDAFLLIGRMGEPDWEVFLDQMRGDRLALWGWARLEYLAERLGAPVPDRVRSALRGRAAAATALERDHALYAAREVSGDDGLRHVRRGGSLAARARLLFWLVVPSRAYLRTGPGSGDRSAPAMYLARILRYLTARRGAAAG